MQLPLFHVSGLQALYHSLGLGLATLWPVGRFSEERVLELTERHRVTAWSLMATQIWRILEHEAFDRYDLESLAYVGGGGSTWAPELIRMVHAKLPRAAAAMTFGFGQTETGGMGTVNAGASVTEHPDSVGEPRPTVEVEIRGADGGVVAEGVDGDIYLRGPFTFLGYWDDPAATAATLGRRRLAAHRRPRSHRARPAVHERPAHRPHRPRRRERLSRRDREPARRASRRRRVHRCSGSTTASSANR